jgi:hypothetical protein
VRAKLNPSNPNRRLVCMHCTPERQLRSPNWFAVYCPRCGLVAVEEMTAEEHATIQSDEFSKEISKKFSSGMSARLPAYLDEPPKRRL